ncbi:type III pantothenate kinase [Sedimenticola hydrogenitrophicus]|uniref:type III pantothenate kinase n=1 Tax=Sedimenticola hydrogenitrophicus TaxID=2967975 RepID=UPI0021A609FF|nr:type III pantothenate kinase [Sedimenticola hydrogenitrophicus]
MNNTRILLIDIGNTNLKWSLLEAGRLSPIKAEKHHGVAPDQLATTCWGDLQPPDAIYLANVAGADLESGLTSWMQGGWGRTPHPVRPVAQAQGVSNGYREPGQLGVDRWLTLLAVRRQEAGAVCVVDCGTAITLDLMDSQGRHLGGLILPGLDLMRESLLQQTRIPRVGQVPVESLFARDTASAVASAAVNAAAALIERSMRQAAEHCGEPATLILTGSDAARISVQLDIPFRIDHELVMKGLVAIAEAAG